MFHYNFIYDDVVVVVVEGGQSECVKLQFCYFVLCLNSSDIALIMTKTSVSERCLWEF